jgi:osmotically-inducible protein OsmY
MWLAVVGGCAHSGGTRAGSSNEAGPEVADAFRAVRSGAKATETAGQYQFCATPQGLEVVTTTGSSQLNSVIRNSEIESTVRNAIEHDPRLKGSDIQVKTVEGEVALTGQVPSDDAAIRATKDALNAEGVVFVNVALTSPQSPEPPAKMENPYPGCRL